MTARRTRLDVPAMALLLVLCAIWGLTQVSIKLASPGISPLLQAGLRSTGAALLLWAWSAIRGIPLFGRDGSLGHGLLIASLFAGEFVLIYWGLTFTTAARSVLFVYTAPFVVALGAHLMLPGERLHGAKVVGLVCAFAGIVIAFADGLRLPTRRELIGDGMALLAAVFWALTTLAVKARGRPISPSKTLFYQLAGSAVILLALSALVGEAGVTRLTPVVLGALVYQTVITAFVSYLAWFWLLAHYPASELTAFSFWTPLFGVLAGGLVLGEPVTGALALAMVLVVLGTYLVNRAPGTALA